MTDEPEHENCHRCKRNVRRVHPNGFMVFLADGPALPEVYHVLLCASCVCDFGEWLIPNLKEQGEWISEKDQLLAAINEHWNRQ